MSFQNSLTHTFYFWGLWTNPNWYQSFFQTNTWNVDANNADNLQINSCKWFINSVSSESQQRSNDAYFLTDKIIILDFIKWKSDSGRIQYIATTVRRGKNDLSYSPFSFTLVFTLCALRWLKYDSSFMFTVNLFGSSR